MKLKITISLMAVLFTAVFSNLTAQTTINRADYTMQITQNDTALEMSSVNFPVPSKGLNQLWDYSSYTNFPRFLLFRYTSASSANFPTANQKVPGDLLFNGSYYIEGTDYFTLSASSYVENGTFAEDTSYSITNRTGGPNDSIYFIEDARIHNNPDTLINFPIIYLDSNRTQVFDTLNFLLTVAAFGLNKTPGQVINDNDIKNRIVGSGKIIIPQQRGQISDTMDVLLNERIETRVDSIFLNGNPAPPTLLAAFGLTQGQTIIDTIYSFYRKGYQNTITQIDYRSSRVLFYFNADVTTGLSEIKTFQTISGYPNPVNKGEIFRFESFENFQNGTITLRDISGKMILTKTINNSSNLQLQIPESIQHGIYFIEILNLKSNEKFINKVIVN